MQQAVCRRRRRCVSSCHDGPSTLVIQKLFSDTFKAYVRTKQTYFEHARGFAFTMNAASFAPTYRRRDCCFVGRQGDLRTRTTEKCASLLHASLHAHTYTRTVKAESFGLSAHFHGVRGTACTRQESTRWWLLLVGGSGCLASWPERARGVDRLVGRRPVRLLEVPEDFAVPFSAGPSVYDGLPEVAAVVRIEKAPKTHRRPGSRSR